MTAGSGTRTTRPLRLALLGSRGIPARYGGYETLMEELATRLAGRGHEVTVYCRAHYTPRALTAHRGVRLVVLPTLRGKYLDTPVHTFLSCLHAAREGYDAALVVNGANALFLPLLRSGGVPVALNVDGIEKRRAKWGLPGQLVYALSERLACLLPDALVTDADVIHDHYLARYGTPSTVITYGVEPLPAGTAAVERLGLAPGGYVLYVSRFEPENNPHRVAAAWRGVPGDTPLVMVGGAPYADRFIRSFRDGADPRIRFPGPIYGDGYRELMAHAAVYVHATEVGGTHPALVEALGYGPPVVVHDTVENRETAGEAALYFDAADPQSLAAAVGRLLASPALRRELSEAGRARARARFGWAAIADAYERLLADLAAGRPAR